jgi:RNA polymerase sigma-70 factor (ECF subfamily)
MRLQGASLTRRKLAVQVPGELDRRRVAATSKRWQSHHHFDRARAGNGSSDGRAERTSRPVKLHPVGPLSVETEEALVERAVAGEREAFEELVRRHADRLYAVILRFLGDRHLAEEATQEAFLRAWRGISRFRGRSQFFTWLYRIGLNEAKRAAMRQPPTAQVKSLEKESVPDAPDWSDAPEVRVGQGEIRAVLERAIRALPIEYRATIILRDVEGLSTKEAAEAMELGEAAFKSRLHRARLAVRRALEDYLLGSEK